MYEGYFGLKEPPFPAVARTDRYFAAATIESARQTLTRCIQRGEGVGMLIGPSGTGKTLLCQILAHEFQNDFCAVLLARGWFGSRRALLQAILHAMGKPYRGMEEGELRLALTDLVTSSDNCRQGLALLVDDAHLLTRRLLDELCALLNLTCDGQPRVRLVLSGSGVLEERFASPKLESFSQRIAARCYLESFSAAETADYIRNRLTWAGGRSDDVFTADAAAAVHRATDGVPRLVSQLCDHALVLACTSQLRRVETACVEEAWADLQQLPTPWNDRQQKSPAGDEVIEFGGLDEATDATGAADSTAPTCSTVPMLRIRPLDDELPAEPVQQLQRIEDALEAWDDDLQATEAIGPDVELVCPDPGNPFSEPFEEEELVIDRPWCAEASDGGVPTGAAVQSFSTLAAPATVGLGPATQSVSPAANPAPANLAAAGMAGSEPGEEKEEKGEEKGVGSLFLSHPDPSGTVGQEKDSRPLYSDDFAAMLVDQEALSGVPLGADADMIIIEDGYDDAPPPRPVTPVSKPDYRRLFTRLRAGELRVES